MPRLIMDKGSIVKQELEQTRIANEQYRLYSGFQVELHSTRCFRFSWIAALTLAGMMVIALLT